MDDGYDAERADLQNLKDGLEFEIINPQFQGVSCDQCRKFWFDPIEGRFAFQGGSDPGKPKPLLRPPEARVLCETDIGCRKGHYTQPKGLNAKNRKAVLFYQQCLRAGVKPDDPIYLRNMILIQEAEAKHGKYGTQR